MNNINSSDSFNEENYKCMDDSNNNISNNCNDNLCMIGNAVNFQVYRNDNEIKADIVTEYRRSVRIWGQVRDSDGTAISSAYVKLAKVTPNGFLGIAHTITDYQGFYQFEVCPKKDVCDYIIIVGKASTGDERVLSSGLNGVTIVT